METFNPALMKARYLELLSSTNRRYIDYLIKYLETTDFFEAPASSNYHGNYKWGLLEHSLEVYEQLDTLLKAYKIIVPEDSKIIMALLHDICKADFYKSDIRNVKIDGVWNQVPYYSIEDKNPLGHGEKSVIVIQKYIQLSDPEIYAIRWHMGPYDSSAKDYSGNYALTAAMNKYPIIGILHAADMLSINSYCNSVERNALDSTYST